MTEETPTANRREELAALLRAMAEEQADAMDDLVNYLNSEEGQAFRDRVEEARPKTVPDSRFDNALGNVMTVLDSLLLILPGARAELTPPVPAGMVTPPPSA